MATTISMTKVEDGNEVKLEVDNSTNYREFSVEINGSALLIKVDDSQGTIDINNLRLPKIESQLLREFLNYKPL